MSAPAAKAFSLPVMTIAPIPGSASNSAAARGDFVHHLAVERVERLRPVQRDDADALLAVDQDGFVGHSVISRF